MDAPSSIWPFIVDFILQERVDSEWAKGVIATIPSSILSVALDVDPGIRKSYLLHSLENDLQCGSFNLHTLQTLELIEEIDRPDNIDYLMCLAYWAVAAHCTAQSVREDDKEGGSGREKFKDLVDKLWRARVGNLVHSDAAVGLLSSDLYEWYECLATAKAGPKTRDRILQSIVVEKTEERTKDLLGQYVREARREMGPSFIHREYEKVRQAEERDGLGTGRDAAVPGACHDGAHNPSSPQAEAHQRDPTAPVLQKEAETPLQIGKDGSGPSAKIATTEDGSEERRGGGSNEQGKEWGANSDDTATPKERCKWRKVSHVNLPRHTKNTRRTRKKWNAEEEHTLIKAVRRFGKGEWKKILDSCRSVFEGRTEVDLKDKWRNMIKPNKHSQDQRR